MIWKFWAGMRFRVNTSPGFFDNGGNHPVYRVTEHDRVWIYTGEFQRATHTVSEDGKSMKVHWDWSKDGQNWNSLCDLKGAKS